MEMVLKRRTQKQTWLALALSFV